VIRRMILLALLAAAVPFLQNRVDRLAGEQHDDEIGYVWSAGAAKRLFPGFEGVVADLYWIRTLQYFGRQQAFAQNKKFQLLESLIDVTVTLDPRFEIAYTYGGIFLSMPYPQGAGRPDRGVALLDRGARAMPRSWFLQQLRGYLAASLLNDTPRAVASLNEAAQLPGAPFWLHTLAAELAARGGERQKSREIWNTLARELDPTFKRLAVPQLQRLDALDQLDAIDAAIAAYRKETGGNPPSLSALRLAAAPVDPTGKPYVYDPADGRARISRESTLWRDLRDAYD
jgi:tetratricopeptide (TPR) repeat protein